MKKFILLMFIIGINELSAADKDNEPPTKRVKQERPSTPPLQEEGPLAVLSPEIKVMIIQQLTLADFDFDRAIENIRNLTRVNSEFRALVNDDHIIQSVLTELSKQFGTPESMIAFALNTPGSRTWIQRNNIANLNILETTLLNTTNFSVLGSNYLRRLADQLNTTPLKFALHLINQNSQGHGFFHPAQLVQNTQSNLFKAYRAFCLLFVILQNQITPQEMREFGLHLLAHVEWLLIAFLQKAPDESIKEKMVSALKKIEDFAASRMQ